MSIKKDSGTNAAAPEEINSGGTAPPRALLHRVRGRIDLIIDIGSCKGQKAGLHGFFKLLAFLLKKPEG